MQQQRSDRLVAFLATLVTYPFMFLLTKRAAAVSAVQMAGVSGGMGIDTRKRLADFPEGAALVELERSVEAAKAAPERWPVSLISKSFTKCLGCWALLSAALCVTNCRPVHSFGRLA